MGKKRKCGQEREMFRGTKVCDRVEPQISVTVLLCPTEKCWAAVRRLIWFSGRPTRQTRMSIPIRCASGNHSFCCLLRRSMRSGSWLPVARSERPTLHEWAGVYTLLFGGVRRVIRSGATGDMCGQAGIGCPTRVFASEGNYTYPPMGNQI